MAINDKMMANLKLLARKDKIMINSDPNDLSVIEKQTIEIADLKAERDGLKRGLRNILSQHKDAGAVMNTNYTKLAGQMAGMAEIFLYESEVK